ncbi:MAG: hypothetical protein SGCHY_004163 [Lobulomycetales sp.]
MLVNPAIRASARISYGNPSTLSLTGIALRKPLSAFLKLSPTKTKAPEFFELESNAAPIKLQLGDQNLHYSNLQWKSDLEEDYEALQRSVDQLQERNRELEMENQLVKYKVSVLLDMLTASKLDLLEFQSRVMNLTLNQPAEK